MPTTESTAVVTKANLANFIQSRFGRSKKWSIFISLMRPHLMPVSKTIRVTTMAVNIETLRPMTMTRAKPLTSSVARPIRRTMAGMTVVRLESKMVVNARA